MATIGEEMQAQNEREKQERRKELEFYTRMKAYENIATIKGWIVLWSIIAIVCFAISIIAFIGSLAMTA